VRLDSSSQNVGIRNLFAKDPTPSKIMMEGEREEALANALARLPEDQRRAIYLRSRKHLGYPEIGKIMNRSADAVRLLWIRAVERLAAELRQE
jgi:RNA polymerase sigma factor (sigma-70 family)